MDFLTKVERSKRMSLIKGKWTKQELKVHNYLKGWKIKHTMYPSLSGTPDVLIGKTVIFIHGCFWHGCYKCKIRRRLKEGYWKKKIETNKKRDLRNHDLLRSQGYNIFVIWEHDLDKKFISTLNRIISFSRQK